MRDVHELELDVMRGECLVENNHLYRERLMPLTNEEVRTAMVGGLYLIIEHLLGDKSNIGLAFHDVHICGNYQRLIRPSRRPR
jgi:hypothetical protein